MAGTPLPAGDRHFEGLVTTRLRIDRLTPEDAARLAQYRNDPDVAHFQDWTLPYTIDQAQALIGSMADSHPFTPGEWFQFALHDRQGGALVGDVGLYRGDDDPRVLRVGYTLARDAWGRGLATEGVSAVLDHAAALCGATTITADALAANEPSLRLLRRLGFREVERAARADVVDGVWMDEVFYRRDETPPDPAVGAILVGGASRRMGSPKALIEIDGATMFDRVAMALATAGLDVVVVGDGPVPAHTYPTITDPPGIAGPVAGIAAALNHAAGRSVFVSATDQPLLTPATIRRLLAIEGDAVLPIDADRVQVTCGVYRPGFARHLEPLLATDPAPSIQDLCRQTGRLVEEATWSSWGENGRSWRSIDTPEALEAARSVFADAAAGRRER